MKSQFIGGNLSRGRVILEMAKGTGLYYNSPTLKINGLKGKTDDEKRKILYDILDSAHTGLNIQKLEGKSAKEKMKIFYEAIDNKPGIVIRGVKDKHYSDRRRLDYEFHNNFDFHHDTFEGSMRTLRYSEIQRMNSKR